MGDGRKKGKIRNTKINNENNMYFHALLDVESVPRDSWSPPPIHGSIHKSRSAYSKIPKRLFHPFQEPSSPLSILLAHPTRGVFTLFVDYSRVTGSTSMCKDPWMGITTSRVQQHPPLRRIRVVANALFTSLLTHRISDSRKMRSVFILTTIGHV